MSKSFLCQPTMVVYQVCTQEFSRTEEVSRNKVTLRDISATTYKQKALWGKIWVFFHLGTPETAFLVRNIPIDSCNLGIFDNKQGHSFKFPKKSRGGLSVLPSSLLVLTYFKVLMSPSEKFPRSFQKIWLLFWMEGEMQ